MRAPLIHRHGLLLLLLAAQTAHAETLTRGEALEVAESFRAHRWEAAAKNIRHGVGRDGVEIHTPDRAGGRAEPESEGWRAGEGNVGVAYKWGGFDTLASFDAGVRAGKAAGDVYTLEKRRLGGKAVSGAAVGIDCSGFISRCWKLPRKESTSSLASVCRKLASPAELAPGDIMNQSGGHVLLFAKWLDDAKTRSLFYEAAPFSKVRTTERAIAQLAGYTPLRHRSIRD